METNKAAFEKDLALKHIKVTRSFNAPQHLVWQAWTKSEYLDQWWAPKPWKAETRSQDFKEGGSWLYAMVGPEGEKHWAKVNYIKVDAEKSFEAKDIFCDENGIPNQELPNMHWKNAFEANGDKTDVTIDISFTSEEHMRQILEMGFEEGFNMGLGNLDELIANNKLS